MSASKLALLVSFGRRSFEFSTRGQGQQRTLNAEQNIKITVIFETVL